MVGLLLRFMFYQHWSHTQMQTEHPPVCHSEVSEWDNHHEFVNTSIHPQVFDQARQQVTFNIREAIWSTSGSDYLLNQNKTTHSIFVRKGMERYSSHFTHSLAHWLWSEELMKVTKSTRGQGSQPMMLLSYSRSLDTVGLPQWQKTPEKNPTRPNSGRHELCYFQIKRKNEETENTKLLWKWVYSTGDKIQIPDWLFAWECFWLLFMISIQCYLLPGETLK